MELGLGLGLAGVGDVSKNFFRPFGPQFALKLRGAGGGRRASRAPALDPPLLRVFTLLFNLHFQYTAVSHAPRYFTRQGIGEDGSCLLEFR